MKRRRRNKRKSKRVRKRVLVPTMLASFLVPTIILCLSYLWIGAQSEAIGREITSLESERESLAKDLASEQNRWANLRAPLNFKLILSQHNLDMRRPPESRIVRIRDIMDENVRRVVSLGELRDKPGSIL